MNSNRLCVIAQKYTNKKKNILCNSVTNRDGSELLPKHEAEQGHENDASQPEVGKDAKRESRRTNLHRLRHRQGTDELLRRFELGGR